MLWPGLIIEPTAGRFEEVNPSPMLLVVPCLVILWNSASTSSSSSRTVQPMPVIFRTLDPMFASMKEESRPVEAPGLPTTSPPKSTSGGEMDRNGAALTSFP